MQFIMIGSQLGVYSNLKLNQNTRERELNGKQKESFKMKASCFRDESYKTTRKYLKVIVHQHWTVPNLILREISNQQWSNPIG